MSQRYNNGSHYENHQKAAELHTVAAHAHRTAAEQHDKQEHETGQQMSRQALEHSQKAYEHTQEMLHSHSPHTVVQFGHDDIEKVAYELWQQRGCPFGSPEEDWHHAAAQLRARNEH